MEWTPDCGGEEVARQVERIGDRRMGRDGRNGQAVCGRIGPEKIGRRNRVAVGGLLLDTSPDQSRGERGERGGAQAGGAEKVVRREEHGVGRSVWSLRNRGFVGQGQTRTVA